MKTWSFSRAQIKDGLLATTCKNCGKTHTYEFGRYCSWRCRSSYYRKFTATSPEERIIEALHKLELQLEVTHSAPERHELEKKIAAYRRSLRGTSK